MPARPMLQLLALIMLALLTQPQPPLVQPPDAPSSTSPVASTPEEQDEDVHTGESAVQGLCAWPCSTTAILPCCVAPCQEDNSC
jgi:hypothetical protein